MEIDWKERIAKYGYRIDLEITTNDDLMEYMETKIYLYTRHNLTDYLLWIVFQEDFKDFMPELFKQVQSGTRMGIHNYLIKRGVYITKHSNRYPLGRVLTDVLLEEEPYK